MNFSFNSGRWSTHFPYLYAITHTGTQYNLSSKLDHLANAVTEARSMGCERVVLCYETPKKALEASEKINQTPQVLHIRSPELPGPLQCEIILPLKTEQI